MAFQFNPLFLGFMLVIGVATAVYEIYSNSHQAQRQQHSRQAGPSNTTNTFQARRRHKNAEKKEDEYVELSFFFSLLSFSNRI